jgi:hypothetical protein
VWAVVFLRIDPEDIGPPTPVVDIGPALP